MSISLFRHLRLLLPMPILALLVLVLTACYGTAKTPSDWSWIDILGEGGAALMALCWLIWLARSRPAGRVTNLLLSGVGSLFLALWADVLDEFFKLPATAVWDKWFENIPMPVGLILLTVGIYHLHQEQLALNWHMRKRERLFREHRDFDALTPLTGAAYLRRQLVEETAANRPYALIRLELKRLALINREHGYGEGDRVLQSVSQLLILNVRDSDLICRLAGDRFVALLPATEPARAQLIADELVQAVASYAHKILQTGERLQLAATAVVVTPLREESVDALVERLAGQWPESAPVLACA